MIIDRYLATHILKASAVVLLTLASLDLFFTLVQKIDLLGKGGFTGWRFAEYLLLLVPESATYYLPLAALIGSMLSLGALSSNSELVALRAAGMSPRRLAVSVVKAALILTVFAILMSELVVPWSGTRAREVRAASLSGGSSLMSRQGVWVKEGNRVIFVGRLFPDGSARWVEIHEFDAQGRLEMALIADSAIPRDRGWLLKSVALSRFEPDRVRRETHREWFYQGALSEDLLASLAVDPEQMSSLALLGYIRFLEENGIDDAVESLALWRKLYAPFTLIVMMLLALPFVSGSQRQVNVGQRLVIGILLGLVFVMLDKLLIQLGLQWRLPAAINALLPTALFTLLTALLMRRSEHPH